MPFIASLLLGAGLSQALSDAQVDERIGGLHGDQYIPFSQSLYDGNPDRFLWNYRKANGFIRSRILHSVHVESPKITPILKEALKEKMVDLRVMATTYLGRINNDPEQLDARNALLISMRKDRSPMVRIVVAKGMRWGLPGAAKYLIEMLKDRDEPTRCVAALSLASIRDTRSIPTLLSFLGRQPKYHEPFGFRRR